MRRRPCLAALGLVALAAPLLSGCQSSNSVADQVQADLTRTMAASKQFVWTEKGLDFTDTVSGQYEDAYRYHLLYVSDGTPAWEEVVKDDAVADRILSPAQLLRYWQRQRADIDFPTASVTTDALSARRWVVDNTGAPAVPTVGQESTEYKDDPFDPALLFLQDVYDDITNAPSPSVREYRSDDVTPVYKPTDDPFPAPAKGSGITRYDVYQSPLPVAQSSSPNALPGPPSLSNFVKIAIYVKHGMVVEIRLDTDPIDHLQTLVDNYRLSLPKHLSLEGEEAFAQAAIQKLEGVTASNPYDVEQTTMIIQSLPASTTVSLPTGSITGKLSFLHQT